LINSLCHIQVELVPMSKRVTEVLITMKKVLGHQKMIKIDRLKEEISAKEA